MTGQLYSHLSPKLEARPVPEKGGMGVFAREPMGKDELMVLWGGRILLRTQCGFQRPDRAGCYVRYPARRRGLFRLRHVWTDRPMTNSSAPVVRITVVEISQAKTGSARNCGKGMPDTTCPIFSVELDCWLLSKLVHLI